MRVLYTTQYEK